MQIQRFKNTITKNGFPRITTNTITRASNILRIASHAIIQLCANITKYFDSTSIFFWKLLSVDALEFIVEINKEMTLRPILKTTARRKLMQII